MGFYGSAVLVQSIGQVASLTWSYCFVSTPEVWCTLAGQVGGHRLFPASGLSLRVSGTDWPLLEQMSWKNWIRGFVVLGMPVDSLRFLNHLGSWISHIWLTWILCTRTTWLCPGKHLRSYRPVVDCIVTPEGKQICFSGDLTGSFEAREEREVIAPWPLLKWWCCWSFMEQGQLLKKASYLKYYNCF